MKTNEVLQKDVQDAIKWEPLLNAAEIGVTAKDGVITLTGVVDSLAKKYEAEDAARKVDGVKAVVEEIKIKFGSQGKTTDTEIATEVLNAFKWNWEVPAGKIKVKVEAGWVTLDGEIFWKYQKDAAKKTASNLLGVRGVTNNISIRSEIKEDIEKRAIVLALDRNSATNGEDITVTAEGHTIALTGFVHSWYQKDEAEKIAWNAPGVWIVDNELVLDYI
ncbi:MAG: BON domain-containing protein [Bacteroidota bacterium]